MLTATLISTTLDAASGQLTCVVRLSLGGSTNDFNPVLSAERLIAAATDAGRGDWSTEDVLTLLSSDCGMAITSAVTPAPTPTPGTPTPPQ